MVGTHKVGRPLAVFAVVLGLTAIAATALAQTGQLKGKVVDAQGKPVEGAKVTIAMADSRSKFEVKTKKGGDYMQIGLPPGQYTVTVEKDGLSQSAPVKVSLDMAEKDFKLVPGGNTGAPSKEEAAKAAAKMQALKAAFAEGAALSNAGKYD